MENLKFYDLLRTTPKEAMKSIAAGRLKGMTNINPMWRIKIMTEVFGMCGIGWKYEVAKQWLETYGKEIKAFCNINLYVRDPETKEWSDAIPGTGGSSFVAVESRGEYVSDECFKMALTDALSVAMKALGVAADIYFKEGWNLETKYDNTSAQASQTKTGDGETLSDVFNGFAKPEIEQARTKEDLARIYNSYPQLQRHADFVNALTSKRKSLGIKNSNEQ